MAAIRAGIEADEEEIRKIEQEEKRRLAMIQQQRKEMAVRRRADREPKDAR